MSLKWSFCILLQVISGNVSVTDNSDYEHYVPLNLPVDMTLTSVTHLLNQWAYVTAKFRLIFQ